MKNIWKYVLLLSSFNTCVVNAAYAQENFQTEISAYHYNLEDDNDLEFTANSIILKQHFAPVDTSDHPLAEAAFLERIGSVELLIGIADLQYGYGSGSEADGSEYGASITYMEPELPIALQAMFVKTDLEFDSPADADMTINAYTLGIGRFLEDGVIFGIEHSHSETELSSPGFPKYTNEIDTYEVAAKYVSDLPDGKAFNVEGTLGFKKYDDGSVDDTNTIFEVSGDYYFDVKTSIACGLSINTGDNKDAEGKEYAIGFNTFMTSNFNIDIGFKKFLADNSKGEDDESFNVTLSARF